MNPNKTSATLTGFMVILAFSVSYFVYHVVIFMKEQKINLSGNYNSFIGDIDLNHPISYLWKHSLGVGEYTMPYGVYYWFIKIWGLIIGYYMAYQLFISFLIFVGSLSLYLLLKHNGFSNNPAIAGALIYPFYMPIIFDINYLSYFIGYTFIPTFLLAVEKICHFNSFLWKRIVLGVMLAFVFVNIVVYDQRGAVACVIISIMYLFAVHRLNIIKRGILLLPYLLSGIFLIYPILWSQNIKYLTNFQLSVINPNMIINNSKIEKLLLNANPELAPPLILNILTTALLVLLITRMLEGKPNKKYYIVLLLLSTNYILFSFTQLFEILSKNLPYGQLFRHWRIISYLGGFILCYIAAISAERRFSLTITTVILYIFVSLYCTIIKTGAWVETNKISPYKVVNQYMLSKLDTNKPFKVLYVPEMGWFGKNSTPFWAGENFSGQGFPELVSLVPTYWQYYSYMTPVYTWLASGYRYSEMQDNKNIDKLLNTLGIRYVVVHNDIRGYAENVQRIIKNLSYNENLREVFTADYLTVFENLSYKERIWAVPANKSILCSNGLSCVSKEAQEIGFPYDRQVFLSDTALPISTINNSTISKHSIKKNIIGDTIVNYILDNRIQGVVLFGTQDKTNNELLACPSDTHHAIYHTTLITREKYDHSNSFIFGNCFILLNKRDKYIKSLNLPQGAYKLIVKYISDKKSGIFNILLNGKTVYINTGENYGNHINHYNYHIEEMIVKDNKLNIELTNQHGRNIISLIALADIKVSDLLLDTHENTVNYNYNELSHMTMVENYKMENPSLWKGLVKVDGPFILNFAETFNPLWQLEIRDEKGKFVGVYKSIPGFGYINSFVVEAPAGNYKFTITYKPQITYNNMNRVFIPMSVLTIIFCTSVLKLLNHSTFKFLR